MKNYMKMCLLALSLFSLNSCCSSKEIVNQTLKSGDIDHLVLINDSNVNIMEEKSMIIDNEKDLKEFYVNLNATRSPGFEIPIVNFEKQSVIVVAMGEKNSGGYGISSPQYSKDDGSYEFSYLRPSLSSPVTMSITSPGIVILANQKAHDIKIRVIKNEIKVKK